MGKLIIFAALAILSIKGIERDMIKKVNRCYLYSEKYRTWYKLLILQGKNQYQGKMIIIIITYITATRLICKIKNKSNRAEYNTRAILADYEI